MSRENEEAKIEGTSGNERRESKPSHRRGARYLRRQGKFHFPMRPAASAIVNKVSLEREMSRTRGQTYAYAHARVYNTYMRNIFHRLFLDINTIFYCIVHLNTFPSALFVFSLLSIKRTKCKYKISVKSSAKSIRDPVGKFGCIFIQFLII